MTSLRGQERQEFSRRTRALAFKRCCREGVPHCEKCGSELRGGNIVYEHLTPDGLGGDNTLENCAVYCLKICATRKTVEEDNPRMQRADRMLKKAYGIKTRKGRPMMGTIASGWKQKINGGWERR